MNSRRPTCVLHIGMPKAASTSLQQTLASTRSHLAENGVALLDGSDEDVLRNLLARVRDSELAVEAMVHQILEASGAIDLIISAEHLSELHTPERRRLSTVLNRTFDDVHLLIGWRDAASGVVSAWCQAIKSGGTQPFDVHLVEYVRQLLDPNAPTAADHVLARWQACDVFNSIAAVRAAGRGGVGVRGLMASAVCLLAGKRPADLEAAEVMAASASLLPAGLIGTDTRANPRLSVADAERVRRLNERWVAILQVLERVPSEGKVEALAYNVSGVLSHVPLDETCFENWLHGCLIESQVAAIDARITANIESMATWTLA